MGGLRNAVPAGVLIFVVFFPSEWSLPSLFGAWGFIKLDIKMNVDNGFGPWPFHSDKFN